MKDFFSKFDPHVSGTRGVPLNARSQVTIRNDLRVSPVVDQHGPSSPNQTKRLSYFVAQVLRKLKPEVVGKSGSEITALRNHLGETAITDEPRGCGLAFSGDTPIEIPESFKAWLPWIF